VDSTDALALQTLLDEGLGGGRHELLSGLLGGGGAAAAPASSSGPFNLGPAFMLRCSDGGGTRPRRRALRLP
jgi:hypothetical protein